MGSFRDGVVSRSKIPWVIAEDSAAQILNGPCGSSGAPVEQCGSILKAGVTCFALTESYFGGSIPLVMASWSVLFLLGVQYIGILNVALISLEIPRPAARRRANSAASWAGGPALEAGLCLEGGGVVIILSLTVALV